MIEKGLYAIKPKKFKNIEFLGSHGTYWEATDYRLSQLLTQNVLYSAYHSPKTITEIATLLGVKPNLIEEEVHYLESNGFMDVVSISNRQKKYLTNMLIHDFSKEVCEERHSIFSKYAEIICERYMPLVISFKLPDTSNDDGEGIYIPENDKNFFMWSLITFVCNQKFQNTEQIKKMEKYYTKRKDGGENLATATTDNNFKLSFLQEKYFSSGAEVYTIFWKDIQSCSVWIFYSIYDDRKKGFNTTSNEFSLCYLLKNNKIKKDTIENIVLENLYRKGFLNYSNNEDGKKINDIVNFPIIEMSFESFLDILPPLKNELLEIENKLNTEIFSISKSEYPPHLWEMSQQFYQNSLSSNELTTRVLERLLLTNTLKPLTEKQKKTVNMMMFVDRGEGRPERHPLL